MQTFKSIWGGKNALKDTHQNIKKWISLGGKTMRDFVNILTLLNVSNSS